ncbi:MAG TPA: DUF882 domain-containing protein [Candidatus Binatia bacterium]|nr:DUF882 domain-containing protein [Candidatus Binatia bacterium]
MDRNNALLNNRSFISRRKFLALGAIAAGTGIFPRQALSYVSDARDGERSLAFYNTHTGERLNLVYWVQGQYLSESLAEINYILRDHRTDQIKSIDQKLLNLLFALRTELNSNQPFHIISGYRSPQTNVFLHTNSSGVAENSLHLIGKAIDIRIPGRPLSVLRNAAIALKAGGVGYYPNSDFVHLDVGRVRYW